MPQFRFTLSNDGRELTDDGDPQEFPSLEAARGEAIEALREVAADLIRAGKSFRGRAMEITDETGAHLATVKISDAIEEAN